MRSRAKALAERAAKAAVSAIALYNQPYSSYREDAFCLLVVNAWELLFKAKILKENKNRIESIYEFERTKGATASKRSRRRSKKNRAGNAKTIGITKCLEKVRQYQDGIDGVVRSNIDAIIEIRDNAAHFMNYDPNLSDRVFRVGTASVVNFFKLYERWFGRFEDMQFAPLPLAVHPETYLLATSVVKGDSKNLIDFLDRKITTGSKNSEFALAVQMQVTFTKESKGSGIGVRITNDPSAPEVRLSDEDFKAKYPLDYDSVRRRLKRDMRGIKYNQKFNQLMKELEGDANLCHHRFLDPQRRKHGKKFYSEAIIARFNRNKERLDFRT